MKNVLFYGGVPVPFTVSWTAEEEFSLSPCDYAGKGLLAICQPDRRGQGKPRFGKPHLVRQREAIVRGLCDICAKPLKVRTKVSLSHARPQLHSANGGEVLQVEPLLCRPCARISMAHCPSLKRDLHDGSLMVRQVTAYRVQVAVMSEEYVASVTGEERKAFGHVKVELLRWIDRSAEWLEARAA